MTEEKDNWDFLISSSLATKPIRGSRRYRFEEEGKMEKALNTLEKLTDFRAPRRNKNSG
jgi:hypothetical protein